MYAREREKMRQRANGEKRDRKKRQRGRKEGSREEKITAYPLFVGATRRINVADVAVVTGLVSLKDNT